MSDIVGRKLVFLLAHMGECFALLFLAYFPMSLPLIGTALLLMSSTDVHSTIVSAIIADTASNGGGGNGNGRESTAIAVNEGQEEEEDSSRNMHVERRGSTTATTTTPPPPAEAAARFAYVGGVLGFCFIFGPIVGSLLETRMFPRASLHVGYGFVIIAFLYAVLILPETLRRSPSSSSSITSSSSTSTSTPTTTHTGDDLMTKLRALLHVFRSTPMNPFPRAHFLLSQSPLLRHLALAYGLLSFTVSGLSGIFYIFVSARLSWGVGDYGVFLTTVGIVALVSQLFLVRIFVSLLGERGSVLFGMVCLVLSGLIQTVAWNSTCMYVGLLVSTPGFVIEPAIKGAVARSQPSGQQGNLQGSLAAIGNVVKVISPLVSNVMLSAGVELGWIGLPMMAFVVVKLVTLRLLWRAFMVGVGKSEKELFHEQQQKGMRNGDGGEEAVSQSFVHVQQETQA